MSLCKNKSLVLTVVILFAITVNSIFGASGDGGTFSADFLNLEVGARQIGMGGAFTSVDGGSDGDAFTGYWNPAGLATLKYKAFDFMHNSHIAGINQEYLGVVLPLKNKVVLGFNLGIVRYDPEKVTTFADQFGNSGSTFDGNDMVLTINFARNLNERVLFGFNMKYLKSTIADYSGNALGGDFGFIFKTPAKGFNLGLGVYNLGSKIKYLSSNEDLPLTVKFGASYKMIDDFLLASGDIIKRKNQSVDYACGAEISLVDKIKLRGGFNSTNDAGSGITLGIGLKTLSLKLDYAFEPYGEFGDSHKFSMNYLFGVKKVKKQKIRTLSKLFEESRKYNYVKKQTLYETLKEGYSYMKSGNLFGALFKFGEAVQNYPTNIKARLWLAYIHNKLGNKSAAIIEYKNILKLDPNNQNAKKALSFLNK